MKHQWHLGIRTRRGDPCAAELYS